MKEVLIIYAALFVVLIAHEFGHLLFAKLFRLTVDEVILGVDLFSLKIGKIRFSPIIFGGSVVVRENELLKKHYIQIIMFFLGGSIASCFIYLISFINTGLFCYILRWTTRIDILFSICLIFYSSSDMYQLIHYIKMKMKDALM